MAGEDQFSILLVRVESKNYSLFFLKVQYKSKALHFLQSSGQMRKLLVDNCRLRISTLINTQSSKYCFSSFHQIIRGEQELLYLVLYSTLHPKSTVLLLTGNFVPSKDFCSFC